MVCTIKSLSRHSLLILLQMLTLCAMESGYHPIGDGGVAPPIKFFQECKKNFDDQLLALENFIMPQQLVVLGDLKNAIIEIPRLSKEILEMLNPELETLRQNLNQVYLNYKATIAQGKDFDPLDGELSAETITLLVHLKKEYCKEVPKIIFKHLKQQYPEIFTSELQDYLTKNS